jgi:RNA recognition motif-containing protein
LCTRFLHHVPFYSCSCCIDDPEKDENIDGNPFNTLFVTHLSPDLTESDLTKEFELYGQIKKVQDNRKRGCIL